MLPRSGLIPSRLPRNGLPYQRLLVPRGALSRTDIIPTHLVTSGSTTDGTSILTASKTPTANALQLMWVTSHNASSLTGPPTVTGNGLTWVEVDNIIFTTTTRRLTLLRAMGAAPTTGQATISFGADTQTAFVWSWLEFTGVDNSGTNGSGAIVQSKKSATTANTTATNTLDAAFENAKNLHVCGTATALAATPTKDALFTNGDRAAVSTSSCALGTEYALAQIACTNTFSSSISAMLSVEIKAGTA